MGTHPSLPSKDVETKRTLLDLVQDNKALMSQEISKRYGEKLPFLFKVLSIRKALSIQAHPNKKSAEQLHAKDPKNYPGTESIIVYMTDLTCFCQMTTTSQR
jgi:mannose-6-phosphate isomerase